MNTSDLVNLVARDNQLSSKDAKTIVDNVILHITNALEDHEEVALNNFGKFKIKAQSERIGRNPATGESVKIPASNKVSFSASKYLKDTIN